MGQIITKRGLIEFIAVQALTVLTIMGFGVWAIREKNNWSSIAFIVVGLVLCYANSKYVDVRFESNYEKLRLNKEIIKKSLPFIVRISGFILIIMIGISGWMKLLGSKWGTEIGLIVYVGLVGLMGYFIGKNTRNK